MRAVTFVDALGVVDSEPVNASSLEESPGSTPAWTFGRSTCAAMAHAV